MMNTPQLALLSAFEKIWRKRGLLRGSWVLRSMMPRGPPRGRSFDRVSMEFERIDDFRGPERPALLHGETGADGWGGLPSSS
jgi:hypothetical protein